MAQQASDQKDNSDIAVNQQVASTLLTLNDGTKIPQIGLGTFDGSHVARQNKDAEEDKKAMLDFKNAVKYAIQAGYRHVDGAEVYRTSGVIGEALKECIDAGIVKREELWITTKVSGYVRTVEGVQASVANQLKQFQTDYIDLYLIHNAHSTNGGQDIVDIYRTLHEFKDAGKIKSVGVSNFAVKHIQALVAAKLPLPSVNQIEARCFLFEKDLIPFCREKGIYIEAYCPIARASEKATTNEVITGLAAKYNKTWAHIMMRWGLRNDFIMIPKSVNPKRIAANADVFDFKLTADEMDKLSALEDGERVSGWEPYGGVSKFFGKQTASWPVEGK